MKTRVLVLALAGLAGAALLRTFGPYEPVNFAMRFDPAALDGGVEVYLAQAEAQVPDIRPGTHKRVIWAGAAEAQTDYSVLYIHGFSATSEEIRPVPDQVAQALGANLVFTRLTGHGRTPAAMGEATIEAWTHDVSEALAIASRVGQRVLVIATSTGATLASYAATQTAQTGAVAGMVLISPNYGINNPAARLLTWPAARHWVPLVAGSTRSFEPRNDGQGAFWTTSYPTVATLPMAALVASVTDLDLSGVQIPALFIYTPTDQVVRADLTDHIMARWGARTEYFAPEPGPGDDPYHHVIAGDIMSPSLTAPTTARILDFAQGL